jgi:hypothetical protein
VQIYFLASIQKLQQNFPVYKTIIDTIEMNGHKVIYDHILNRNPNQRSMFKEITPDREYFMQMKENIKKSDAVFCVLDGASVNVGYEVSFAISLGIPTVTFSDKRMVLSPLFLGNDSDSLFNLRYDEGAASANLAIIVTDALGLIGGRSLSGMHLPLNKNQSDYLNWVSKSSTNSKVIYIRGLIDNAMSKNSMYKKFLRLKSS